MILDEESLFVSPISIGLKEKQLNQYLQFANNFEFDFGLAGEIKNTKRDKGT